MIFGLGKKAISIDQVTSDMLSDIGSIRGSIDELAKNDGVHSEEYIAEREAILYVLGWIAIQTSNLSSGNKHRFSAELTGNWSKSMSEGTEDQIQKMQFLQKRLPLYRNVLQNSDANTWSTNCISQFINQLGLNPSEHFALMSALSALLPGVIDAETNFLNGIMKQYKFV